MKLLVSVMESTTVKRRAVLLCGHHRVLLESRAAVLNLGGLAVSSVMTEADAVSLLATKSVDLTILCHSLLQEDRDQILAAAQGLKPPCKTLLLVHDETLETAIRPTGVFLVPKGPRALLVAVNHILNL